MVSILEPAIELFPPPEVVVMMGEGLSCELVCTLVVSCYGVAHFRISPCKHSWCTEKIFAEVLGVQKQLGLNMHYMGGGTGTELKEAPHYQVITSAQLKIFPYTFSVFVYFACLFLDYSWQHLSFLLTLHSNHS